MLVTALLRYQLKKITLGITIQCTLYTDARPGIMPQRSGGLENSKFLIQREQRSFNKQKHRVLNLNTPQFVCIFFLEITRVYLKFLVYQKVTLLQHRYCTRGNGHNPTCDGVMCIIPLNLVVLIVMKSNIDIGEIQCMQKVKVVISIPTMNKQVNERKNDNNSFCNICPTLTII